MLDLLIDSLRQYAHGRQQDVRKGCYDAPFAAKLLSTYAQSMLNGLALIGQCQYSQAIEAECHMLYRHLGHDLIPLTFSPTTPVTQTESTSYISESKPELTSTQPIMTTNIPRSHLVAAAALHKLKQSSRKARRPN